jgi:4-amino-4-deoxychorismate lyase
MDFALIETFRFDPAGGFLRLERHLARLENSARRLGFTFDPDNIAKELVRLKESGSALRVRLELAANGTVSVTTAPFVLQGKDTIWNVQTARQRLDSRDLLLAHKTSRRTVYEQARAEYPPETFHEVLLQNERGEFCEGTITNLFIRKGGERQLLTPALSSGLLPGILREEMIEKGKAREQTILIGDLLEADEIFVGNSLRGLIKANFLFAAA